MAATYEYALENVVGALGEEGEGSFDKFVRIMKDWGKDSWDVAALIPGTFNADGHVILRSQLLMRREVK